MNKLLTTLVVLSLSFFMYGQRTTNKQPLPLATFNDNVKAPLTAKEKNQIIEVYGDNAEKYVFSKPHMLKTIKHILRNRVKIKLILNKKDKKPCPLISEVELTGDSTDKLFKNGSFDKNNFNPLKYDFNFYSRGASMYQVDGTNYYIIINSQYQ